MWFKLHARQAITASDVGLVLGLINENSWIKKKEKYRENKTKKKHLNTHKWLIKENEMWMSRRANGIACK